MARTPTPPSAKSPRPATRAFCSSARDSCGERQSCMRFFRRAFFTRLGWLLAGGVPAARVATSGPEDGASAPPATQVPDEEVIRADYDLIVVGGGIAGTSAAISAARNGLRVALVHERSMLGGNSSSEVKLFPENNSGHHPWIREGGIHEEFHTEERVRNHLAYVEGTMNCHWDLVLYEWVIREKGIRLYLNTHMHRAIMRDGTHIGGVRCIQLGTEKTLELSAPLFVDATGDGVLAQRANADFRWGREARSEYGEPLAPEQSDEQVMGNTLFFRAVDTGQAVPFKRPEWAAVFPTEADLTRRGHSFIDGGYWWIEVGAPHHPITDNEEIRHEGLRQLLGVWDHIKNHGDHGAENYGLEFVGFWPYKRESRRIIGDFVLSQDHVQHPTLLDDDVAYGCWGIDIHTQGGILTRDIEPYPPPRTDENWEALGTAVYGIPLRALYSRKIENLLMAGRPISCSYVAFASSRVLSTGSIVGQAVGAAAALCRKHETTPRDVARHHVKECQQIILRQDGHIPGVENDDPADLARQAQVTASSEWSLAWPEPNEERELTTPYAQLFPVSGERIDSVKLLLESKLERAVTLDIGLRAAPHVWDFRSTRDLAAARPTIEARHHGWVAIPLDVRVEAGKLYYVHVGRQPGIFWKLFKEVNGEPNRCPPGTTAANLPGKTRWRPITGGYSLCLDVAPESKPFAPPNIVRGTNRPDRWSNIWISDPSQGLPASVTLQWAARQSFNTVQLTFDTDANRRVTMPLFRYPDCVRDYQLECWSNGAWKILAEVRDNYVRRRVHRFDTVQSDRVRVTVLATNGAPSARVYEARVYLE
ncbi:MAG: FAD-dependent oxidoreductase [Luteitalea sp.]|nr:FAD-dependent oxidoreductase [Luteitalea sp.]